MRRIIHPVPLALFCAFMVILWMFPVFMMGFPLEFPMLGGVKEFIAEGTIEPGDGRLSVLIFALLSKVVPFESIMGWTFAAAITFALSLILFWRFISRIFSPTIAWISVVITAFMPLYWLEAIHLSYYSFAFLFLFASFTAFTELIGRSRMTAFIVSGLLFGLACAAKEVFLVFAPWYAAAFLWANRSTWKKGVLEVVLFSIAAMTAFASPSIPAVIKKQLSFPEAVREISPIVRTQLDAMEFYPDLYTYEFDREGYLARMKEKRASEPEILNIRFKSRDLEFGLEEFSLYGWFVTGAWLFVHNLIALTFQDTVGGIMLWLFVIPGMVVLYRANRKLFYCACGLVISFELIVRFILHFQRIHIMDYGWILAVFAAMGISHVAGRFAGGKRKLARILPIAIVIIVSFQMLQANRSQLARLYSRSMMPDYIGDIELLKKIPEDSLTAVPREMGVSVFSRRKTLPFQPETLERLAAQGKIREVFEHYEVTHINRYPKELSKEISSQAGVKVISVAETAHPRPEVTPLMNYLLHLVR